MKSFYNTNDNAADGASGPRQRFAVPLFWRIFLMVWLAMALTLAAGQLVSRLLVAQEQQVMTRQLGLYELGLEALALSQSRGSDVAHQFLRTQGRSLGLHLILAAPEAGNASHSRNLPTSVQNRMDSHWFALKPAVIELTGNYRLIASPRGKSAGWLAPGFLRAINAGFAVVLISLACWLIARRLSRPLKTMEATARAIAAGDKSLRVDPKVASRRDEIGALAKAFNAMTAQLWGLLERQQQLLRDISHDLRTPLARQRVAIELALDDGGDSALLNSILRQNERLEAMTEQVLTLYRLAAQGEQFARQPVAVMELLNAVLQDAADYARGRDVQCRLNASELAIHTLVLGDAGLLHRAFDNILQNALDHTPPGQALTVVVTVADNRLLIDITDSGPGAPDAALAHLFEPFYRSDQSRGGSGWGLGLAIAKKVIEAHDGQVSAANASGGGLLVQVQLPVFVVS
ncbi:MAG TPA: HAMP domain-containing sensor histidine kinase [Marinobacter sp.]|nr:HAMP domain-containing sensor histidine kinase [Marinobacter sp.]